MIREPIALLAWHIKWPVHISEFAPRCRLTSSSFISIKQLLYLTSIRASSVWGIKIKQATNGQSKYDSFIEVLKASPSHLLNNFILTVYFTRHPQLTSLSLPRTTCSNNPPYRSRTLSSSSMYYAASYSISGQHYRSSVSMDPVTFCNLNFLLAVLLPARSALLDCQTRSSPLTKTYLKAINMTSRRW